MGARASTLSIRTRAVGTLLLCGTVALGGETPPSLDDLRALNKEARYEEAATGARRLLAEVEEQAGRDSPEVAAVLDVLVEALWRGGKATEPASKALAERAVAIRRATLGPDHPDLARSLNNLGRLLWSNGDNAEAQVVYAQALQILETALGPEHSDVGGTLNNIGLVLWRMGKYSEARASFERAAGIQESALGPEHPDLAKTLNNLGLVLRELGEYEEALVPLRRALTIQEKALGPTHPNMAASLSNLANVLADTADYASALPLYERAIAIREKALGPEHPDVAKTLGNLGASLHETGDYSRAKLVDERALAIREKVLGPDHPSTAFSLNGLALLLADLGEHQSARDLYQRALAIREKTLGPDHPEVGATLHNLAGLLSAMGDAAAAEPLYRRALEIRTARLGPEHPLTAASLHFLGRMLQATGRGEEARPLLERALQIRRKQQGDDHPDVAATLKVLADLDWDEGKAGDALARAREAAEIVDHHLRETLPVLPERQALRLVQSRQKPETLLFSGLLDAKAGQDSQWLAACWDWTLRRRGVVLEELAARHRIAVSEATAEARSALERLAAARRRLAALWVQGPDGSHPERYVPALERARRSKEEAEDALARASIRYRREKELRSVGLEDVRQAIPPGGVLVEMARVEVRSRGGFPGEFHDIALVLGPPGTRGFVDLGPSRSVDDLTALWRRELHSSSLALTSGTKEATEGMSRLQKVGEDLRRAIWDPIVEKAGPAGTVYVVPEGSLHQISIEALPDARGTYLIESGPRVLLLGTGRDLVRLRDRLPPPASSGVLALGAPDFDAGESRRLAGLKTPSGFIAYRGSLSHCDLSRESRWPALPETGVEVERIGRLLESREKVVLLTGAEASEERFKRQAPGKRILHLATHGFFLQGQCASAPSEGGVPAGSRSSGERDRSRTQADVAVLEESPLLLSGVVLAGANRAREARPDGEDGVLTAEELAALDLGSVEIAVLSACDTGRGDVEAGEGVFGLRRALELAGARTVVMSLWPVPDRQARRWMDRFYREIASGAAAPDAARRASLDRLASLRKEGRPPHPYLWAGFVTAGDWK